ncbi:MAG: hypothetical protein R2779_07700 [Crocinitomicaceae bacterium]
MKLKLILLTICFSITFAVIAQEQKVNVSNVQLFANEVYKSAPEYATTAYLEKYKAKMERIAIVQIAEEKLNNVKFVNLSEVPLMDKYNDNLTHDIAGNFDSSTFNPLKYRFNYNLNYDQYFRVVGTNYFIKLSKIELK